MVLTVMPSVARQLTPLFHDRPVKTWLERLTIERSLKMRNVLYLVVSTQINPPTQNLMSLKFSFRLEMLVQAARVEATSDFDLVNHPPKHCPTRQVECNSLRCLQLWLSKIIKAPGQARVIQSSVRAMGS